MHRYHSPREAAGDAGREQKAQVGHAGEHRCDRSPEAGAQMAVRRQKVRDWQQAIWWAERGLALHGDRAARPESVDDLRNRLVAYPKLTAPAKPAREATSSPVAEPTSRTIEVLVCEACGVRFDRVVVRGRKPNRCSGRR